MMKKYHLADVLTWSRLICALVLLFGSFTTRLSVANAFWLFVFGELTDAFDGICARRWPYPADGKFRWWRAYIKLFEPLFDISLGVSALIFITLRIDFLFGITFLALALFIGFACQILAYGGVFHTIASARSWGLLRTHPRLANALILFRRDILYSGAITLIILCLLWNSDFSPECKISFTLIGFLIGANIWDLKSDRRTEVETK